MADDTDDFSDASTLEAVDEDYAATFEMTIQGPEDLKDSSDADEEEEASEEEVVLEDDDDSSSAEVAPTNGSAKEDVYFLQRRPEFMTARQKALLEQQQRSKSDTALQGDYIITDPTLGLSEEEILKRKRRTLRRRELARDKSEKEKKQTVERLLKVTSGREKTGAAPTTPSDSTQGLDAASSRTGGCRKRRRLVKTPSAPCVRFVSNSLGFELSFPASVPLPWETSKGPLVVPAPVKCGVPECTQLKRYSCSQTGVPLCSLQCYKRNLAATSS